MWRRFWYYSKLCTLRLKTYTLRPISCTLRPKPSPLKPKVSTLNPKPQTLKDEIRPYLAGTGGGVLELIDIEEPIVKIKLSGKHPESS